MVATASKFQWVACRDAAFCYLAQGTGVSKVGTSSPGASNKLPQVIDIDTPPNITNRYINYRVNEDHENILSLAGGTVRYHNLQCTSILIELGPHGRNEDTQHFLPCNPRLQVQRLCTPSRVNGLESTIPRFDW